MVSVVDVAEKLTAPAVAGLVPRPVVMVIVVLVAAGTVQPAANVTTKLLAVVCPVGVQPAIAGLNVTATGFAATNTVVAAVVIVTVEAGARAALGVMPNAKFANAAPAIVELGVTSNAAI